MHAIHGVGARVLNYYLFTVYLHIYYIIITNISITTAVLRTYIIIMPFYIIIFFH